MPLSEKAKENKQKYNLSYAKKHLKRIPLDVQIEKYEEIKKYSAAEGRSINGFIKEAVDEKIDRIKSES